MKPGKGADRASVLAINPWNLEASISRRKAMLAAFLALDEDTQADLLERAETISTRQGATQHNDAYLQDIREIIAKVHQAAGWE